MPTMAASLTLSLPVIAILVAAAAATKMNITKILSGFPEYGEFNGLLTKTKIANKINSRATVTVCVLPNGALSSFTDKYPLSVVKNILALHVLLDYIDADALHSISEGTMLATTLYETMGNGRGKLGYVNITALEGDVVAFGSGIPGSPLDSFFSKSVKQFPYNLSIIELTKAIAPAELLTAPSNITALLEKAGCKMFASLLASSGVLRVYESAVNKGLTIFAPKDDAFNASDAPDLNKLKNVEVASLLEYHALATYTPVGTLKKTKGMITTLATNGAGKYYLTVKIAGNSVSIDTGVDSSRIASTVLDSTPLCIFTVESLLLPIELFGKPPSPAPGPAPEVSPSQSLAKAPTLASAPESAAAQSLPEPPNEAPLEGPMAHPRNSTTDKNSGVALESPAVMKMLLAVSVSVFAFIFINKII